jgi:hypothetical protein
MLAPRPANILNQMIPVSRNLEASVRSRDTDDGTPWQRDLIEAGLN